MEKSIFEPAAAATETNSGTGELGGPSSHHNGRGWNGAGLASVRAVALATRG